MDFPAKRQFNIYKLRNVINFPIIFLIIKGFQRHCKHGFLIIIIIIIYILSKIIDFIIYK